MRWLLPRWRQGHGKWLLVWTLGLAGLAACDPPPVVPSSPPAAGNAAVDAAPEFNVLATSDLRDAQPLEAMVEKATGVHMRFIFGGTVESTEAVLSGTTAAHAAWFANARYLLSDPQGRDRVKQQAKIMLSPIVVGVSRSAAHTLGWNDPEVAGRVSWQTIAQAAASGKITYAMSSPTTSNQGYMALMGVAAAVSRKAEALSAADVDRQAIADFLKGYKLQGETSTELSDKFLQQQNRTVNTFINYESWLLSLNRGRQLREQLTLIYPHEGVSTADYPFMLLKEDRQADYVKVATYLQGSEAQSWLALKTGRRPVNPDVAAKVADFFPKEGLRVELPFSPDRALADGLIDAYLNEFRRPIASTFVLDTSGSMQGERREQLVQALRYLAGNNDHSLTGRLARLTNRERVWVLPFADQPGPITAFEIPDSQRGGSVRGVAPQEASAAKRKVMDQFISHVEGLKMEGGTALYDSVLAALQHMRQERAKHPQFQYSVVAFTDGENRQGRSLDEFEQAYALLPEDVRSIPVFMVMFGEASEQALHRLVKITGGKVFDARKTPLYNVFKDIRTYQ